ncbi:MAG: TetR/AcrR family transcriptional regulator [Rubricoccaceae bacterium]
MPPPITGDAAATRAALLDAARFAFTEHGYDHAGVREIADRAGVTAALVNRYFGSKLGLLAEVVADSFTVGNLLVGDRSTLGERLARYLVRPRTNGFDPTLLLLRSAASPDAGGVLRAAIAEQAVRPLAEWLGGDDARERAGLVMSVLFGFALSRDVLHTGPLSDGDAEVLVAHLGPTIQRLLDGS